MEFEKPCRKTGLTLNRPGERMLGGITWRFQGHSGVLIVVPWYSVFYVFVPWCNFPQVICFCRIVSNKENVQYVQPVF